MILNIEQCGIEVRGTSTPSVQYALTEVQEYLLRMSDKHVPVTSDKLFQIYLEQTDDSQEGFTIEVSDNEISIRGGSRGVIYGTYEFLERMGCRFFTETCEYVPRQKECSLEKCSDLINPVLKNREHYHQSSKNIRYALKSRLNGSYTEIPLELGGKNDYAWFCHSFEELCNPKEYYEQHPEFFSLVPAYDLSDEKVRQSFYEDLKKIDAEKADKMLEKFSMKNDSYLTAVEFKQLKMEVPSYFPELGKYRLFDRTQLCLTNPDLLVLAKKKVRELIKEKPNCKIISISQNDWENPCQCDNCKKVDEENESYSGTVLSFVNEIAKDIEDDYPDYFIDTFAYLYSRKAPSKVKARDNVIVRLCSIECCFTHPMGTCDDYFGTTNPNGVKQNFADDVKEWNKCCSNLWIWDYTTNYSHYMAPHVNWKTLQPNLQFLVENGVSGMMEQGNYSFDGGTDLNELRSYLIGKLMWDPNCDVEKHKREFLNYYYGPAGEHLNSYIELLCSKVEKENIHCGFAYDCKKKHFDDASISEYENIFETALKAVKDNYMFSYRVQRAYLSIRYLRLKTDSYKKIIDGKKIDEFFKDCEAFDIFRLEEWCNKGKSRRAIIESKGSGGSYYVDHFTEKDPLF